MIRSAATSTFCALLVSAVALAEDPPILVSVPVDCTFESDADVIRVSLEGKGSSLPADRIFCDVEPGDTIRASFTFVSEEKQEVRCVIEGRKRVVKKGELGKSTKAPRSQKDRPAPRIGLALSGGGFRATAFHLGVMRRLEELRLLEDVTVISTVSGGSIAGAAVVAKWKNRSAGLDQLEDYLSESKSVAVSSILRGLLNPFRSRLDKLEQSYDRDLFDGKTLRDLQCCSCPKISLNATNLANGKFFSFVSGGPPKAEKYQQRECVESGESPTMGDYKTRTLTGENADHAPGDLPISRAVAASSAFPPAFDPLKLEHDWFNPRETVPATPKEAEEFARLEEEKRRDRAMVDFERCTKSNREDCAGARDTKLLRARDEAESRIDACAKDEEECTKLVSLYDYVTLTDAGVYDNLGWIALKRDWKQLELDYVIVSDASMPAGSDSRPPTSGVGALRGAISIMSQRSRTLEIREVMALKKEGSVPRSLFFSINSKPPKDSSAAERRCAEKAGGVGTDLKSLSPDEMRLLTGRGGSLVEARLRDNTDLLVH